MHIHPAPPASSHSGLQQPPGSRMTHSIYKFQTSGSGTRRDRGPERFLLQRRINFDYLPACRQVGSPIVCPKEKRGKSLEAQRKCPPQRIRSPRRIHLNADRGESEGPLSRRTFMNNQTQDLFCYMRSLFTPPRSRCFVSRRGSAPIQSRAYHEPSCRPR